MNNLNFYEIFQSYDQEAKKKGDSRAEERINSLLMQKQRVRFQNFLKIKILISNCTFLARRTNRRNQKYAFVHFQKCFCSSLS